MSNQIKLIAYSEKSIAVIGDETKNIKDHLAAIGGKYNGSLTVNGEKTPGWIFVTSKKDKVKEIIMSYINKELPELPKKELSSSTSSYKKLDSDSEFTVSKDMYLSVITRLERLEAELANLKKGIVSNEPVKTTLKDAGSFLKETPLKQSKVVYEDEEEEEASKQIKSLFKTKSK